MNLEEFYRLPDVYYEACAHLRVYGCTGGDTICERMKPIERRFGLSIGFLCSLL